MWLSHHVVASGIEALIVLVRRRAEKLDSRSTKRLKQALFLKKNRAELEPQHALLGSHFGILDRRLKSANDLGRRWSRGQNRRGRPRVGEEAGNSSQGERPSHGDNKEGQEAGQGGGTARPDAVRQTQLKQPSRQTGKTYGRGLAIGRQEHSLQADQTLVAGLPKHGRQAPDSAPLEDFRLTHRCWREPR